MSLWETGEVIEKDKLNQKNILVAASAPNAANTFEGMHWFDTTTKRLKVAYETSITGENVGTGDGSTTTFYLANTPVKPLSETIYADGLTATRDTDYTIDYDTGAITFSSPPPSGVIITADYTYFSWKFVTAENITEIPTRNHADLQGIGANDHHAAFTATDHDARDHSAVAGTITLSELGSKAHSELTGIGANDHHAFPIAMIEGFKYVLNDGNPERFGVVTDKGGTLEFVTIAVTIPAGKSMKIHVFGSRNYISGAYVQIYNLATATVVKEISSDIYYDKYDPPLSITAGAGADESIVLRGRITGDGTLRFLMGAFIVYSIE
jgi:hypothetical protein